MSVARITIVQPLPGHEEQVKRLMEELHTFYTQQPGFLAGFVFRFHPSHHRHQDFGRVGVWESKEAADRAALQNHTSALRSQLNQHIGSEHEEWLVDIIGTPTNLPIKAAR